MALNIAFVCHSSVKFEFDYFVFFNYLIVGTPLMILPSVSSIFIYICQLLHVHNTLSSYSYASFFFMPPAPPHFLVFL